jgi:hypothetical protein
MSMKNSNDTIGNRARDFPAFNAMPQLTTLLRAPSKTNKPALTKKYNVLSALFSIITTELKLFRDSNSKFASSVSYKKGKFG